MFGFTAKPTTSQRNNHPFLSIPPKKAMSETRRPPSTQSGSSDYRTPDDRTLDDDSDDDMPLAQAIPTALTAQKSIRIKEGSRRRQKRPGPLDTTVALQGKKKPSPTSPGLPTEELMRRLMALKAQEEGSKPDSGPPTQLGSAWTSVVMPSGKAPPDPSAAARHRTLSTRYGKEAANPAHGNAVSAPHTGASLGAPAPDGEQQVMSRGQSVRVPSSTRQPRPIRRDTEPSHVIHSVPPSSLPPRAAQGVVVPLSLQENRNSEPVQDVLFTVNVYVFDIQRMIPVDVHATSTAKTVLESISKRRGLLPDVSRLNELTLWELANDFGMERPLREFELLRRVCESWDLQKPVNAFMVRYSPLSKLLTTEAVPRAPPMAQGEVQWQVKRGKWSKRHLSLQEGSVYLGKAGKGKDESFLCSLTNHDFYYLTRVHKAPKPFVFAIKSTDNIAFFENPAESVHLFALGAAEGERLREQILLARSFILYREQAPVSPPPVRKHTLMHTAPQPAQPALQFTNEIFRKGTLLGNIGRTAHGH